MEPYYRDDAAGIELYLGDNADVLPLLAPADLVLVDPPYGDTKLEWDTMDNAWTQLVTDALMPNGSLWLWGSLRSLLAPLARLEEIGWRISQDIVWEKHNGSGSAADRFRRVHEHAVLLYRGAWGDVHHDPQFSADATARQGRRKQRPTHWGDLGEAAYSTIDGGPRHMRSVMFERSAQGHAIHPTQKPEGITRTLLQYSCPPGGLVLDPYAGSATTLIAARACGRRAIGIERDEAYAEAAAIRLDAPAQHDLFTAEGR